MWICGRVLVLVSLLALGACDPTPRVFASIDDETLTAVPAAAGVMVAPIQGLPEATDGELRKAIMGALQAQGIPATTASAGRAQATLVGQADVAGVDTGTPTFIAWTLADPEGRSLASFTGTAALAPGRIVQENPGALSNIVRQVNDALAGAGRRPLSRPAGASRTAIPVVSVLPVEGAPSDGREVLADALRGALRGHGLRVADGIDAAGLIVFGDVLVEPVGEVQEKVSISWQVRWPDGRELGVVSQSNTVPRGATASSWMPVAPIVATNAADGIARLVRQDLPAPTGGGTPTR